MGSELYDAIGQTYAATRVPDPRIGAQIHAALGEVGSVVNVGAGAGAYEPRETVLAVEPSAVMIAQRPAGSAPAVQASAEALPLADDAVDAALALLTVHHWRDLEAGVRELRRVARRRVVVLHWDAEVTRASWLMREYLFATEPFDRDGAISIERLVALLGGPGRVRVVPVAVPHDCTDGFAGAFWRRPAAYLDPAVRAGISSMAGPGEAVVAPAIARLAADLASGAWHRRHAELLELDEIDVGYRLVIAEM